MSESTWYKWLAVSTLLHFICVGVFSISLPKSSRRIDLSSAYSVGLVGDIGGGPKGSGGVGAHISDAKPAAAKAKPEPTKAKPVPAKEKPTKKEKAPPVKEKPAKVKPVPVKNEKEVSLSKKKVPVVKEAPKAEKKETPTREELDALNRRLREIKKKTDYLDVAKKGSESAVTRAFGGGSGSGNLAFSGEGGGGGGKALDLPTQKYIMDVWEKVKEAWGLPGPSFKKLETEVTIKIRKDGRIIDINMDKRSGNRLYDESILRALRSVDPLPPIPPSINQETIEIPFRFRPGEMS